MIKILQWIAGDDLRVYQRAMMKLQAMYDGVKISTVGCTGEKSRNIQPAGGGG